MSEKDTYVEPSEYIPKDIRQKYGLGEYAKSDKENSAETGRMVTTEKRLESDIEASFLSPSGGYTHNNDAYDAKLGLFTDTLIRFIKATQLKEWTRFESQNAIDPERKFCNAFNTACDMDGLVSVLRHGFKHRGITFKVCYFKPESSLNQTALELYEKNEITCNRQWY